MPDAKAKISLELNGEPVEVAFAPHKTLLEVVREDLGLTGTKHGCELGECGACTVLLDGAPVLSCLTLPVLIGDAEVSTVEGLAGGPRGQGEGPLGAERQPPGLHPLQTAFAEEGA